MESEVTYNAFEAFRPQLDALATAGYFKLVPASKSQLKNSLHYAYRVAVWIMVVTYNLQHLVKVIQERDSADKIVNTLFILLTTISMFAKQLTFNARSTRLDRIFDIIRGPVFAPETPFHVCMMRRSAGTMLQVFRVFRNCSVSCGALWAIFPFVKRALGQKVDFSAYIPFDTQTSPGFELAVAYLNLLIMFQAYGNVALDCTIVSFYAQAKVQLGVLRDSLEHLVVVEDKRETGIKGFLKMRKNGELTRTSREKTDVQEKNFELRLQERFIQCIVRHQHIKWFVSEVESIFAAPLFVQFLVTAWVICMTMYKIVGINEFSVELMSMLMYLICMLIQLLIYCYYGTQVKYESDLVAQSTYFADWSSLTPRFRRQLLFLMQVCKKPITLTTAYVVPISLETYIKVLRASYTLFTLLDRK